MVTIGVLALQGDVDEHMRALERSGARALRVRRADELEQIEGLIIPGGESTTMSKLLTSFGLFDPLAQRIRSGLPVWGTCAGMIMLASSILDGREDQRSFGALRFWPTARLLRGGPSDQGSRRGPFSRCLHPRALGGIPRRRRRGARQGRQQRGWSDCRGAQGTFHGMFFPPRTWGR